MSRILACHQLIWTFFQLISANMKFSFHRHIMHSTCSFAYIFVSFYTIQTIKNNPWNYWPPLDVLWYFVGEDKFTMCTINFIYLLYNNYVFFACLWLTSHLSSLKVGNTRRGIPQDLDLTVRSLMIFFTYVWSALRPIVGRKSFTKFCKERQTVQFKVARAEVL